jgi:aminopeptidase-like protein
MNEKINSYLRRLFPVARSITGEGNRETLQVLSELIPLQIHEVPSLTKVYDWLVPNEWTVQEAWIKNGKGEKIIEYEKNNLHLLNYSIAVHEKLKLTDLLPHLYFLKSLPDAVPYKTSYYKENWGFCISYNDYEKFFTEGEEYEVYVDSSLKQGYLTYADYLIKGRSEKEYLLSTYICHPSLANDNLSGIVMSSFLAAELEKLSLNYSYRFVFAPETIGAITYCSFNEEILEKTLGGFVVTCVAGPGDFGYKETFLQNHLIDRIVKSVFAEKKLLLIEYPFEPEGSDERQFSSPGIRLPMGLITKDKFHEYEYYHTSLDNLEFISSDNLLKSFDIYLEVIKRLDKCFYFVLNGYKCEPQLGKRNLYPSIGRTTMNLSVNKEIPKDELILKAAKWILFYADGKHNLQDVYEKTGLPFDLLENALTRLLDSELIKEVY